MLQIVAGSEKAIADSQDRLSVVAGGLVGQDWLERGIKAGFYSMRELEIGGIPSYRYFFHLDDQEFVNVNAALFIGPGDFNTGAFFRGVELIAEQLRAKGIIFQTRRRGLIEQSRGQGYVIEGVVMSKLL